MLLVLGWLLAFAQDGCLSVYWLRNCLCLVFHSSMLEHEGLSVLMIIAIISIAQYCTNKGEHTALYKINNIAIIYIYKMSKILCEHNVTHHTCACTHKCTMVHGRNVLGGGGRVKRKKTIWNHLLWYCLEVSFDALLLNLIDHFIDLPLFPYIGNSTECQWQCMSASVHGIECLAGLGLCLAGLRFWSDGAFLLKV